VKLPLTYQEAVKCLSSLHDKYVIVPVDKASNNSLPEGMFKEVMNDLWLARISSLSNEVGLYVVLLEVLLFPLFMIMIVPFFSM
jgi:hypothetical protein